MTGASVTERDVEQAVVSWFVQLGYESAYGPDIALGAPEQERESYQDVVLVGRLRRAIGRINPLIPEEQREEVVRRVVDAGGANVAAANRDFHRLLVDGADVSYQAADGRIVYDKVWLVDFDEPDANDWLVVNQLAIEEPHLAGGFPVARRPDLVVYVNGMPLAIIELKNPADPNATLKQAFNQLRTYQRDIPRLFPFTEVMAVSDGFEARAGTLTSDWERFLPWRSIAGEEPAPKGSPELQTLVNGIFEQRRLLDLVRHFVVFHVDGPRITKILAAYHQFHAVNRAVDCTVRAATPTGDRRAGVVWHTQGSGKSLSMVFYAGKVARQRELANPTLVVVTDRNDLDEQLFAAFADSAAYLRLTPVQVESRDDLRDKLNVASGGIVFSTIQKFLPDGPGESLGVLSDRRNVIVVADEAHRSHYGLIRGYARNLHDALPNACFLGFTGTPISSDDRNTRAIFGDYIDVYDIQRAVEDGATVRIYYEGRLARLELKEDERPRIDPEFDDVTEGEEGELRERLKSKWASLEAMVGTEKRIDLLARDLVDHFERRQEVIDGKALVVGMSRRICVDLYDALVRLRPDWHDAGDSRGAIKVVMTGSATDPLNWQQHIRSKARREALSKRFKDPDDPLKLVIVRDMWLTGFDCPSMHTMYVDKPMRGHGLMQAIARVNRVFKDKPGGLIVDYLGLADELRRALGDYTAGDRRETGIPREQAVEALLRHAEILDAMFHGFDFGRLTDGFQAWAELLVRAEELVLTLPDGKRRFLQAVIAVSQAFALAAPDPAAMALRDRIGFYQAVRARLLKVSVDVERDFDELDSAVRQIVSSAVSSDQVIDVFSAAGLSRPEISILSEEFLHQVSELPQQHLALEALRKLLSDEIHERSRKSVIQARLFSEMLAGSIRRYQDRTIQTAEVIAELVALARQMRAAPRRGEALGLTDDELAFFDALSLADDAVEALGSDRLCALARELTESIRKNATIDWTERDSSRARLRVTVRLLLLRNGYPSSLIDQAAHTILEQAGLLTKEWAA